MKRLFLFLILSVIVCNSFADDLPKTPKFGKVTKEELEMTVCAIDSSASAVILFDVGVSNMTYNKQISKFVLETRRHIRIKIFKKDGFDYADVVIGMYKSGSAREKVTSVKAQTYNLENGEIVTTKIGKNDIFEEEVSERRIEKRFTLPQVKEGSVIEYTYVLESEFTYTLESWDFQHRIPTLLSALQVIIPEFHNYSNRISGYEKVSTFRDQKTETIVFTEIQRSDNPYNPQSKVNSENVSYNANILTFVAENIPALKNEVYVDNIRNYLTRVDFELKYIQYPGESRRDFSNTWEKINKDLLEHDKFGGELTGVRFMRNELQLAVDTLSQPIDKMMTVYNHIKNTIKWNEKYRLFTENSIRTAYKEGSGNSAEVNLCLVAALREVGLVAYPIVLSTRSNGLVHTWDVTIAKFNHVVVGASINDNIYLLDATSNYSVPNILPLECLNGNGRIIDKDKSDWIDLYPKNISRTTQMGTFTIGESGEIKGNISQTSKDYTALRMHNILLGDENYDDYRESLEKRFNNGVVDSIEVDNKGNQNPEIMVKYQATIPDSYIDAGEFLYLTPGIGLLRNSNAFVSKDRKLPINFHFPFEETIVLKYVIPEGFALHEVPQNKVIKALEGKTSFTYSVSQVGNEIMLINKFTINQTLFSPDNYALLKEFYDFVATKNSEKIVLKKL